MNQYAFALAALSSLVITPVYAAQNKRSAPILLTEQSKSDDSAFVVSIQMPQNEIETSIDTGRVAADQAGGGLLEALIINHLDDKKKRIGNSLQIKAEEDVMPLRRALANFDIQSIALASTQKALTSPAWLKTHSVSINAPFPANGKTAYITYNYDLSPDFSSLRLFSDITLNNSVKPRSAKSALIFRQGITSVIQLRKRSYNNTNNILAWSAEDGKLAKVALTEAFTQMEQLIPKALNLRPADISAYKAKNSEQAFAAGYNGAVIQRGGRFPDDLLIWTNGLLQLHTLP